MPRAIPKARTAMEPPGLRFTGKFFMQHAKDFKPGFLSKNIAEKGIILQRAYAKTAMVKSRLERIRRELKLLEKAPQAKAAGSIAARAESGARAISKRMYAYNRGIFSQDYFLRMGYGMGAFAENSHMRDFHSSVNIYLEIAKLAGKISARRGRRG